MNDGPISVTLAGKCSANGAQHVQLVEQHRIRQTDPRFAAIDAAAFAAKNLYNLATYTVRQAFIHEGKYIPFARVYHLVKDSDAYRALPRKVSQLVLKQVHQAWMAFFVALRVWRAHPGRFLGRPKLPGYKDKQRGRSLLVYNAQAISRTALKQGLIKPSGLDITIQTKQRQVNQVRIVPRKCAYVVEVVYTVRVAPNPALDENLIAGIDIGLNNPAHRVSPWQR